jgi:pimeloyl-ACP methyl ester carboxylesterase
MPTWTNWLLEQMQLMPPQLWQEDLLRGPERIWEMLLGEREVAEVRAMLDRPPAEGPRVATVFMPGVMGSLLASVRGISALLWFNPRVMVDGQINLLDLNEDGTADHAPDVDVVPIGIEKMIYLKLILTLARETRLYEFPYDWRKRLEYNARLLHAAIERWAAAAPGRQFVLVGHSMGGVLARTYAALFPAEAQARLRRVILIGSPLYGAAMTPLVFGGETPSTRTLARLHPDNDVAALTRSMPSLYQLLPPPPDLFAPRRPYPCNWDLYDAHAWGVPGVRQDYLDEAWRFHQLLANADPQVETVQIAGCHQETVTDVWHAPAAEGQPAAETPRYTLVCQEGGEDSGDGLVPLWSAYRAGRPTYFAEAEHSALPGDPRVLSALLELVHDGTPELPDVLPEPSGVLQRLAETPLAQQVSELRRRFEQGRFSRDDLRRMLFAQ